MTENSYNEQFMRALEVKDNIEDAISALDTYQYHLIGQPITVRYLEDGLIKILFAVGVKDSVDKDYGPEYYSIVGHEGSKWEDM